MDADEAAFRQSVLRARAIESAIVYSAVLSPDGRYLVCGTSTGLMAVWDLDDYLVRARTAAQHSACAPSRDSALTPRVSLAQQADWFVRVPEGAARRTGLPVVSWTSSVLRGPVYNMCFAAHTGDGRPILCSGGAGGVCLWDLAAALAAGGGHHEAQAPLASLATGVGAEVNGVACGGGLLYGALGSGQCRAWDLSRECAVADLGAAGPMLSAVATRPTSGQPVTCGEDGLARLWDVRAAQACVASLAPAGGQWLGALAIDASDTWLACGGGACEQSMWHLGTAACTAQLATAAPVQALAFADSDVAIGCEAPHVLVARAAGGAPVRAQVCARSVFALAMNTASPRNRVLVAAGASPYVDVFASLDRRAFSLCCAPALAQ